MTISIDPQKTNNESLQPKGWLRYFSFSLDHKVIGIQYLVCGFLFYLIIPKAISYQENYTFLLIKKYQ